MYTVGIITSSDKGYAGEREDKSGAVIKEIEFYSHDELDRILDLMK